MARREHQAGLAAVVIADQDGVHLALGRLEKNAIGLQIEVDDALGNGFDQFRRIVELHEGRLQTEGGADILKMGRPEHAQHGPVARHGFGCGPAGIRIDMVGRIRPGKFIDAGRVGLVFEEAGRIERAMLPINSAALGKIECSVDGVSRGRVIGELDGHDVVIQDVSQPSQRVYAKVAVQTGQRLGVRNPHPRTWVVDGPTFDGRKKSLTVVHRSLTCWCLHCEEKILPQMTQTKT